MPQVFINNRVTGTVLEPKVKRMKAARVGGKLRALPTNPVNRKQRRAARKLSHKGERANGKTVD
jgi:hypothetical protein